MKVMGFPIFSADTCAGRVPMGQVFAKHVALASSFSIFIDVPQIVMAVAIYKI